MEMSRGVFPERGVYTPPTSIKTTKGWVRADRIFYVYRDGHMVKIKCDGISDDRVVVVDPESGPDIDKQVDWMAQMLWGDPTTAMDKPRRTIVEGEEDRCPSCGVMANWIGRPDSAHCEDAWHAGV